MHMADALLSPAAGAVMIAASAGAMGYSALKIKKYDLGEKKVPVMAVAGAFVFAAQMINFTIPGTGSSGHIGGGILLAAMLGAYPSLLTVAAVLIIQALFFADGGLLALGCNIFNMGVIPCLLVYPLIYRRMLRKGVTYKRITVASVICAVIALQLGAFAVVLQTTASGISVLPFGAFLLMMQPIHLAIGVIEGLITAAVLCFVHQMRPELMESGTVAAQSSPSSMKKLLLSLAVLTVATGGLLSLYASGHPDGLEWSIERVAGTAELPADGAVYEQAAAVQDRTAFMPDYDYAAPSSSALPGTSVAGLIGGGMTFLLAGLTGFAISRAKRKKQKTA